MRLVAAPRVVVLLALACAAVAVALFPAPAAADDGLGEEYRDHLTTVAFRPPTGWTKQERPTPEDHSLRVEFRDPANPAASLGLIDRRTLEPRDVEFLRARLHDKAEHLAGAKILTEGEVKVAACPGWRLLTEWHTADGTFLSYQAGAVRNEQAHFELCLTTPKDKAATALPLFEKVLESVRVNVHAYDPAEWRALDRYRTAAARTSGLPNRLKDKELCFGFFSGDRKVGFLTWKVSTGKLEDKDAYEIAGRYRLRGSEVMDEVTYKVVLAPDLTQQTFEAKRHRTGKDLDLTLEVAGSIKEGTLKRTLTAGGKTSELAVPVPPGALFDELDCFAVCLAGAGWEEPLAVPLVSTAGSETLLRLTKGPPESDGRHTAGLDRDGEKSVAVLDDAGCLALVRAPLGVAGALEVRALSKEDAEKE